MSAYLVAHIQVSDAAGFGAYGSAVPAVIEKFGGRYLVRGGGVEVLEGDWVIPRLVVVAFDSHAQAKAFYDSPEYQKILPLRKAASEGCVVIVDGVDGG